MTRGRSRWTWGEVVCESSTGEMFKKSSSTMVWEFVNLCSPQLHLLSQSESRNSSRIQLNSTSTTNDELSCYIH
jgi:hypothetical protein